MDVYISKQEWKFLNKKIDLIVHHLIETDPEFAKKHENLMDEESRYHASAVKSWLDDGKRWRESNENTQ